MNEPALLVSFCNRTDGSANVLAAVTAQGILRWFDLNGRSPVSACGLTFSDGMLFCGCSDEHGSYIAIFDSSGLLRDYVALANVGDVHSICTDGSSLFAASTQTDEIVRLSLSNLSQPGEVVWRAGAQRRDLNHVNSVAFAQGALLCGGFGPKNGPAWSDAYDGFIYDVGASRYVTRGIFHPHSLMEHQGALYFCESSEGSARTLAGAFRYVDGYARGLVIADGRYYVGASRGRRSKTLSRYVLNPADAGVRAGRCGIYSGSLMDPSQSHFIDLSGVAEEIYDVCVLPEPMYAVI